MMTAERVKSAILQTYTEALLTARSKGIKGLASKELAVMATARYLTHKLGARLTERSVLAVVSDMGPKTAVPAKAVAGGRGSAMTRRGI